MSAAVDMSGQTNIRNLRHKTVKVYDDDEVEDEIDGKRTFDVLEKIKSEKYDADCILELTSEEFSFKYIQRNGFYSPIRFKEREHLGLHVPDSENFGILDVQNHVGAKRVLDVMECVTQRAMEMTMKDFAAYFEGNDRKRIYNVISLEFSQTRLAPLVRRPSVVDKMDWIDLAWPPHLKCEQSEQTNKMSNMKYPKVQKYCLMSVGGCYTDFHVDFGGTSVWYHIMKGQKIFWLIPPTNKNLDMYERWTMSGKQGDLFFGDLVDKCQRVHLDTGDSLMIPSGWIHAVYTPVDSIVFGGNFLHSFNIPMQLRVAQLEERLHVPPRFRFPYFQEVLWYTIERYICNLTGQSFLTEEYQRRSMLVNKQQHEDNPDGAIEDLAGIPIQKKEHVHLTSYELKGLQRLVESLERLPKSKKFIPIGIENPFGLLTAAKQMIFDHLGDDPELAVTGEEIAHWPKPIRNLKRSRSEEVKAVRRSTSSSSRVRRVRCKQCEACMRGDCGECVYCKDMKKFGGPGTMKQSCLLRRCTNPSLPSTVRSDGDASVMETPPLPPEVPPAEDEEGTPVMKKCKLSRYRNTENGSSKTPKIEKVKMSKDQSPLVPRVTVPRITKCEMMKHAVRPSPFNEDDDLPIAKDDNIDDATVNKDAWMQIFKRLPQQDLCRCMRVCVAFLKLCSLPSLWKNVDLSESPISADALRCIVRRQPQSIDLTRSYVSSDQLDWLLKRCPGLRSLNLTGNSWPLVSAISSASCPPLIALNLSWVSGLTDSLLKQLLAAPRDARPGQQITHTRLRYLRHLYLNGTDATNAGVSLLPVELPHLESLDLSYCSVSDKAVRCLVSASNDGTCPGLHTIVARSCPDITAKSLKHIGEFRNLRKVDFSDCCQITEKDCLDALNRHCAKRLQMLEVGLMVADHDTCV